MATTHGLRPHTVEELMRLPDDGQFHELDAGRLVCIPPSAHTSSAVAALLLIKLGAFVLQHSLGRVTGEQGGFLLRRRPDIVRAPDVGFIQRDRLVNVGPGYFPGAPDLAVEVLSPTDRYSAVSRKVSQCLCTGTRLVWVIDPYNRTVAVHRRSREVIELTQDGVLDGEDVLPAFHLALAEIWV